MLRFLSLVVIIAAAQIAAAGDAQETIANDTIDAIKIDTILYEPELLSSPALLVTNPVNFEERLTQKPTVALLKSMTVPGWGQLGNRKYIKAVAIIGLQTWFISSILHFGDQASDFRAQWAAETDLGMRLELWNLFDDRRKRRNKFTWFAGISTFVSMFDAYVDAHLSGSPRDPRNARISMNLVPREGGAELRATLNF